MRGVRLCEVPVVRVVLPYLYEHGPASILLHSNLHALLLDPEILKMRLIEKECHPAHLLHLRHVKWKESLSAPLVPCPIFWHTSCAMAGKRHAALAHLRPFL